MQDQKTELEHILSELRSRFPKFSKDFGCMVNNTWYTYTITYKNKPLYYLTINNYDDAIAHSILVLQNYKMLNVVCKLNLKK